MLLTDAPDAHGSGCAHIARGKTASPALLSVPERYRVGYEDASQFSREYKRLFGEPPMRNAERLRQAGEASAAAPP